MRGEVAFQQLERVYQYHSSEKIDWKTSLKSVKLNERILLYKLSINSMGRALNVRKIWVKMFNVIWTILMNN